jgi:membrane-anchored glycerophosphoryl diester phosphodiesterase (GDPDase)
MTIAIFLIDFLPAVGVLIPALAFLLPATAGGGTPPLGLFAVIPLVLVLAAVGFAVAFRLSLLLPARAVGDLSITFKQAWLRTRGNTWRLFWGIALATVPPLLLVQIAFLTMLGFPTPDNFAGQEFVAQMTITSTVTVIYDLLTLPIGIGFLSHAYRHFFQEGLEPVE